MTEMRYRVVKGAGTTSPPFGKGGRGGIPAPASDQLNPPYPPFPKGGNALIEVAGNSHRHGANDGFLEKSLHAANHSAQAPRARGFFHD
jgi:hypothetical protein